MAKPTTQWRCQSCNQTQVKWGGFCANCKGVGTLIEEPLAPTGGPRRGLAQGFAGPKTPTPLTAITATETDRFLTGYREFDRVLGGGLVPGSVVLLGGAPGIGKSTILLQAIGRLTESMPRILYASGEESPQQIKLRADRLGITTDRIHILSETCLEPLMATVEQIRPQALVVDSIQTTYTSTLTTTPGGISQVQEVASQLMHLAKRTGIPIFIIGHVTKSGHVAGPMTLAHLVDTVLMFEGDKSRAFRVLRTTKNRFGPVHEIGVWRMQGSGLQEVDNPSAIFLAERQTSIPGSAIVASLEGTRPLLIEIQALVSESSYGTPRRTTTGFDGNRLALLLAVLEKRVGLHINDYDVFLNLVGGIELEEPAMDLGAAAAISSAFNGRPLPADLICIGEIGLGGEVRAVNTLDLRLQEAARLGFTTAIVPHFALDECPIPQGITVHGVRQVQEAFEFIFDNTTPAI